MVSQSISTNADSPGTINGGATDTNTISVGATEYVEWYGTIFSIGGATTANAVLDCEVNIGSTEVGTALLFCSSSVPLEGVAHVMCPSGTHVQGAPGEDLVITIENLAGSGSGDNVRSTTFYRIRDVTKGN